MEEKLYCPNCGIGIRPDWVQCPKCLKPLNYGDSRGSQNRSYYPKEKIKDPGIAAILSFFYWIKYITEGGKGIVLIILYGLMVLSFLLISIPMLLIL